MSKKNLARKKETGEHECADWKVGPTHHLESEDITRWRATTIRNYVRFCRVPYENLLWMTIIHNAIETTHTAGPFSVSEIIEEAEAGIASRCRRKLPGIRIRGVHEIDVVRYGNHASSHKMRLMEDFGIDLTPSRSEEEKGRIVIPHLHCVIDIDRYHPSRVREEFAAQFPGYKRTFATKLHSFRPVKDNLETLGQYSTKLKLAYSNAWNTRQTKFGDPYEPEWISYIVMSLSHHGLDNLNFSYGCNR